MTQISKSILTVSVLSSLFCCDLTAQDNSAPVAEVTKDVLSSFFNKDKSNKSSATNASGQASPASSLPKKQKKLKRKLSQEEIAARRQEAAQNPDAVKEKRAARKTLKKVKKIKGKVRQHGLAKPTTADVARLKQTEKEADELERELAEKLKQENDEAAKIRDYLESKKRPLDQKIENNQNTIDSIEKDLGTSRTPATAEPA